jgi:hypothetical protein
MHEDLVVDEETRFSSVNRGKGFEDSGYEEREDILCSKKFSPRPLQPVFCKKTCAR